MEHNWHRIPVVLAVAVENPISLTAFLAAARAWIEQTSPGMLLWETREHAGASYVRVSGTQAAHDFTPDGAFREAALYYAALPGALYLTLNETHLRNAIDRSAARRAAAADADATAKPVAQPWLGESMALKASGDAINYFDRILEDPARNRLRSQAWGNIHILNEWKLAMNAEDAVEFHREWWGTELVCPGGGEYVWNDETQSHESTVFGSPAHLMPDMPAGVKLADHAASIELGITFEGDGLRARGEIKREKGAE